MPEAKPVWTRCKGCRDRVYNDPVDISIHRDHCPADLLRKLDTLTKKVDALDKAVDELGEEPEEQIDLDAVAPWPDEEESDGVDEAAALDDDDELDEDDDLDYVAPITPTLVR